MDAENPPLRRSERLRALTEKKTAYLPVKKCPKSNLRKKPNTFYRQKKEQTKSLESLFTNLII